MTKPLALEQLLQEHKALNARITAMKAEQKDAVIEEIKSKIAVFGLTIADLGLYMPSTERERNDRKRPVLPKYRDPETGTTWSGRGNPPLWIAGKDRTQFVIT